MCLGCSGGVITSSDCCYVSSVSKACVLVCQGVHNASKCHCNCFMGSETRVLEGVALYLLVQYRQQGVTS